MKRLIHNCSPENLWRRKKCKWIHEEVGIKSKERVKKKLKNANFKMWFLYKWLVDLCTKEQKESEFLIDESLIPAFWSLILIP